MTGPILPPPTEDNDFQGDFVARVAASFARVTGGGLAEAAGIDPATLASEGWGRAAWNGRFALLTHRGDAQATLNYANAFALHLWALSWEQMCAMPSRDTAPEDDQPLRADFMARVAEQGFSTGYRGHRVSRNGRLFEIRNATVWRLTDEKGADFGAGALFRDFDYL